MINNEDARRTSWAAPRATIRAQLGHQPGMSLPLPPAWVDDALCAQVDAEMWFPDKGGTPGPAKSICGRCPVAAECLAYALEHNERFGVWGGVSERDRRGMRRAS